MILRKPLTKQAMSENCIFFSFYYNKKPEAYTERLMISYKFIFEDKHRGRSSVPTLKTVDRNGFEKAGSQGIS